MNGYRYNTIAEANTAIQQVNTNHNFIPIEGNTTQTLVSYLKGVYEGDEFFYILENDFSIFLGVSEEILIDDKTI
jgi:hypothetical protein